MSDRLRLPSPAGAVGAVLGALVAAGLWFAAPWPIGTAAPVASPPAASPAPASKIVSAGVALVDDHGGPLPSGAAQGARTAFDAIRAGDTARLATLYTPAPGAPLWASVRRTIAVGPVRSALSDTLRTSPSRGAGGTVLYRLGNYGIRLTPAGTIDYIGPNRGPST